LLKPAIREANYGYLDPCPLLLLFTFTIYMGCTLLYKGVDVYTFQYACSMYPLVKQIRAEAKQASFQIP